MVTFMAQCLQTVGCNTEVDMQQNISKLKQAANAFQQQGAVSGAHLIMHGLDNLERQVAVSMQEIQSSESTRPCVPSSFFKVSSRHGTAGRPCSTVK